MNDKNKKRYGKRESNFSQSNSKFYSLFWILLALTLSKDTLLPLPDKAQLLVLLQVKTEYYCGDYLIMRALNHNSNTQKIMLFSWWQGFIVKSYN